MQLPIYPTMGLSPHLYSRLHAAPHLPHHGSLTSPILETTCSPPSTPPWVSHLTYTRDYMQPPIYPTMGLSPHLYSRLHAAPHLPHHGSLTTPILETTCSPPSTPPWVSHLTYTRDYMQPPIYPTMGLSPHLYSRLHAAPHLPHHGSLTSPILKTTCSPPPHLPHHRSLTSPILKTTCSPPPPSTPPWVSQVTNIQVPTLKTPAPYLNLCT